MRNFYFPPFHLLNYLLIFLLSFALAFLIFSAKVQAADFDFEIDYGKSKIFSQAEMDFCIEIIKSKLEPSGCTIRKVRYAGDNFNSHKNRKYLNSLAEGRGLQKKFVRCMVFYSDFKSPPDDGKISAWNYDSEYKDWQWWFGLYKVDGEWKLLTEGY